MDTPTAQNHWFTVLTEQGRSMLWLAKQTGRTRRTIYAYRYGTRKPTADWLQAASRALGQDVAA